MCKAIAELHAIDIIHGDVNSNNIMVNEELDVKLIDFDNSSYEGNIWLAAGNFDFCTERMRMDIQKNKRIKSLKSHDTYPLSLCCLLLLGDNKSVYLKSLSAEEPLNDKERGDVLMECEYKGKDVVVSLNRDEISAEGAALKLNKILLMDFDNS
jgi:serine/threonine protein kinase